MQLEVVFLTTDNINIFIIIYQFSSTFLLPISVHQFYIFWEANDIHIKYSVD